MNSMNTFQKTFECSSEEVLSEISTYAKKLLAANIVLVEDRMRLDCFGVYSLPKLILSFSHVELQAAKVRIFGSFLYEIESTRSLSEIEIVSPKVDVTYEKSKVVDEIEDFKSTELDVRCEHSTLFYLYCEHKRLFPNSDNPGFYKWLSGKQGSNTYVTIYEFFKRKYKP